MDPNIERLIEELKSDREDTRKRAVIALGRYAEPVVLEALKKTLNDPSTAVRYFAKKAVREIETAISARASGAAEAAVTGSSVTGAKVTDETARGATGQSVIENKTTGQFSSVPSFSGGSEPTGSAVASTGFSLPATEPPKIDKKDLFSGTESITSILNALKDPDDRVKIEAIKKLGEMREVVACEPLLNLIHAENRDVRLYAVQALGLIKDPKALTPMLNLLNSEQDPFVNATLVKAIARVGGVQLIPILARYLKDEDPRVRANTVEALEIIGDQKIIKFLVPLLQDPNNRVKANVVKVLSKFGRTNMLEKLGEMLEAKEPDTRASAVYALGAIGTDIVLPLLFRALEDPVVEIAVKAIDALSKIKNDEVQEKLSRFRNHSNPVIREAVEKAIGPPSAPRVEVPSAAESNRNVPPGHEGLDPEEFDRLWTEINERLYHFAKTHPSFTKKEMANFLELLRESILFSS